MTETNHSDAPSVPSAAQPDNVIAMGDRIADAGQMTEAAKQLEKQRAAQDKLAKITMGMLEADALKLEEAAIVGNHDIQKRHGLMDQARALRMTITWIGGPPKEEPKNAS